MADTSAEATETEPINILIVDDSATMRMIIRRVIDLTAVPVGVVYEAANGLEAMKVLDTCRVHALFTDINMPVMSGYELLHAVSQRTDLVRIVVTTDGTKLREAETRELNVDLYIKKPFRPEVVRNALSRIVNTNAR